MVVVVVIVAVVSMNETSLSDPFLLPTRFVAIFLFEGTELSDVSHG